MQNSKVLKLFYGKCCLFPPTKKKHNTFFFFIYSFSGLYSLLKSFLFVKFLPRRKKKKFPWKQEQDWKIVNHNKHEGKKSGWKKAEVIVWLQKKEGKTFQDNDDNETLKKKFKTKNREYFGEWKTNHNNNNNKFFLQKLQTNKQTNGKKINFHYSMLTIISFGCFFRQNVFKHRENLR